MLTFLLHCHLPSQSLSSFLLSVAVFLPIRHDNQRSQALRYCINVLITFIYCREKFLAQRLIIYMAKAISSLVFTMKNISNLFMLWYHFYLAFVAFDLLFGRGMAFFIGIMHGLARSRWYFARILLI